MLGECLLPPVVAVCQLLPPMLAESRLVAVCQLLPPVLAGCRLLSPLLVECPVPPLLAAAPRSPFSR